MTNNHDNRKLQRIWNQYIEKKCELICLSQGGTGTYPDTQNLVSELALQQMVPASYTLPSQTDPDPLAFLPVMKSTAKHKMNGPQRTACLAKGCINNQYQLTILHYFKIGNRMFQKRSIIMHFCFISMTQETWQLFHEKDKSGCSNQMDEPYSTSMYNGLEYTSK